MSKHVTFARARVAALTLGATLLAGGNAAADDVIADDLIVQGSACVGLDCVNNESFGFDTLRLKENNTRIKFEDTSTAAGFPNNKWQLTANDSASGGLNKFSIENTTVPTVPFTIVGPAPTNSLFVASSGKVGLRTSAPALDLHISTTNTPAHRLEQTSGGGFTAQTWDIAGNEANFFIRDVTSGSRLPFRIRPGAPTSSIDIGNTGNVGIGLSGPGYKLHVSGDVFSSGTIYFGGGLPPTPNTQTVCYGTSPANFMGFCSSDIRLKHEINYLSGDSGLNAIMRVKPATFKWRDGDDRVMAGFIAQDVQPAIPAAVHQPAGSEFLAFDSTAVLAYTVKAVQELKAENQSLRAEIERLKAAR
jgi:hypothetical protein